MSNINEILYTWGSQLINSYVGSRQEILHNELDGCIEVDHEYRNNALIKCELPENCHRQLRIFFRHVNNVVPPKQKMVSTYLYWTISVPGAILATIPVKHSCQDQISINATAILPHIIDLHGTVLFHLFISDKISLVNEATGVHKLKKTTYYQPTTCNYCKELLFGVYHQGLQCSECEQNFHDRCKAESKCPGTVVSENYRHSAALESPKETTGSFFVDSLTSKIGHDLKEQRLHESTNCGHCYEKLYTLQSYLRCSVCQQTFHEKCKPALTNICIPKQIKFVRSIQNGTAVPVNNMHLSKKDICIGSFSLNLSDLASSSDKDLPSEPMQFQLQKSEFIDMKRASGSVIIVPSLEMTVVEEMEELFHKFLTKALSTRDWNDLLQNNSKLLMLIKVCGTRVGLNAREVNSLVLQRFVYEAARTDKLKRTWYYAFEFAKTNFGFSRDQLNDNEKTADILEDTLRVMKKEFSISLEQYEDCLKNENGVDELANVISCLSEAILLDKCTGNRVFEGLALDEYIKRILAEKKKTILQDLIDNYEQIEFDVGEGSKFVHAESFEIFLQCRKLTNAGEKLLELVNEDMKFDGAFSRCTNGKVDLNCLNVEYPCTELANRVYAFLDGLTENSELYSHSQVLFQLYFRLKKLITELQKYGLHSSVFDDFYRSFYPIVSFTLQHSLEKTTMLAVNARERFVPQGPGEPSIGKLEPISLDHDILHSSSVLDILKAYEPCISFLMDLQWQDDTKKILYLQYTESVVQELSDYAEWLESFSVEIDNMNAGINKVPDPSVFVALNNINRIFDDIIHLCEPLGEQTKEAIKLASFDASAGRVLANPSSEHDASAYQMICFFYDAFKALHKTYVTLLKRIISRLGPTIFEILALLKQSKPEDTNDDDETYSSFFDIFKRKNVAESKKAPKLPEPRQGGMLSVGGNNFDKGFDRNNRIAIRSSFRKGSLSDSRKGGKKSMRATIKVTEFRVSDTDSAHIDNLCDFMNTALMVMSENLYPEVFDRILRQLYDITMRSLARTCFKMDPPLTIQKAMLMTNVAENVYDIFRADGDGMDEQDLRTPSYTNLRLDLKRVLGGQEPKFSI